MEWLVFRDITGLLGKSDREFAAKPLSGSRFSSRVELQLYNGRQRRGQNQIQSVSNMLGGKGRKVDEKRQRRNRDSKKRDN
jgi:hypothetical protein